MSEASLAVTLLRIQSASSRSPVAVFVTGRERIKRTGEKTPLFNTVFYSTVVTQRMLKKYSADLVGVFDGTEEIDEAQNLLEKAHRDVCYG